MLRINNIHLQERTLNKKSILGLNRNHIKTKEMLARIKRIAVIKKEKIRIPLKIRAKIILDTPKNKISKARVMILVKMIRYFQIKNQEIKQSLHKLMILKNSFNKSRISRKFFIERMIMIMIIRISKLVKSRIRTIQHMKTCFRNLNH